jgi:hypothetical protein
MFVARSDFCYGIQDFWEVFHKNMFAEWSVPVYEFCLLVQLICNLLEFVHIEIDEARCSLNELSLAEWVWVMERVPMTILLNFFI